CHSKQREGRGQAGRTAPCLHHRHGQYQCQCVLSGCGPAPHGHSPDHGRQYDLLTVNVENTQPEGAPINGNFELATQQASTQVLVSDGATVVIGGVIQTTNTV